MAVTKREGDLDHIEFTREPDREPDRRRRQYFPPQPPRPANRGDHGRAVEVEATDAIREVAEARQAASVDPHSLLVLEFDSENLALRDHLEERFGAWVVDEKREEVGDASRYKYLVQFADQEKLQRFQREIAHYQSGHSGTETLPPALRRDFFDALQHVRRLNAADRRGRRLSEVGVSATQPFYLDVDFWHPGDAESAQTLLDQMRQMSQQFGGRLISHVRTSSLLLAKIHATGELLDRLLELDLVARVDFPPQITDAYSGIFRDPTLLDPGRVPDDQDGLACIVDSGVISGHPLLSGWVVDERDFDSGEGTVTDTSGHGTAIGGLVVYGDVARCIEHNAWNPLVRVCSAKVLRHNSILNRVEFPEENRVEEVLDRAIRYFVAERGCRVFNLSLGDEQDIYSGGRQFPWAEKLDELARELDIVIVVAAGNRGDLPIPEGTRTAVQFQHGVRDQILTNEQRLCNPATAALALTVGSIARSDAPLPDRAIIAASPAGAPSPFTRSGPGYSASNSSASAKPDFVAFGGNYGLETLAGGDPRWVTNLVYLGEPTIRPERDGRILGAQFGTSFAAPHVTHAAAMAEKVLEESLGRAPTANLIRAFVGSVAVPPPCEPEWIEDEGNRIRVVGNGVPDVQRFLWSRQDEVCLLAEDELQEDKLHLYRIRVPDAFLRPRGDRGITVSLAFDPPVRASRRDYLSRTMRIELLHGLTGDQVEEFRAANSSEHPPSLPSANILEARPPVTWLGWSTLQVRRRSWKQRPQIKIPDGGAEPEVFALVTCQRRFPTGVDPKQRYALVVRFWHKGEQVQIYQPLRSRVRVVTRVRVER